MTNFAQKLSMKKLLLVVFPLLMLYFILFTVNCGNDCTPISKADVQVKLNAAISANANACKVVTPGDSSLTPVQLGLRTATPLTVFDLDAFLYGTTCQGAGNFCAEEIDAAAKEVQNSSCAQLEIPLDPREKRSFPENLMLSCP